MAEKQKSKASFTLNDVLRIVKEFAGSMVTFGQAASSGFRPAEAGGSYGIGTPRSMSRDDEAMYGAQTGDFQARSPGFAGGEMHMPDWSPGAPVSDYYDDKYQNFRQTRPAPEMVDARAQGGYRDLNRNVNTGGSAGTGVVFRTPRMNAIGSVLPIGNRTQRVR